jgi:hypothetical protein
MKTISAPPQLISLYELISELPRAVLALPLLALLLLLLGGLLTEAAKEETRLAPSSRE